MHRLEVENLTFAYRGATTPVFANLSWHAQERAITCIVGPNGVGKSTLVSLAAGIPPDSLPELPRKRALDNRIEFVLQDSRGTLLPWRTNLENVALAYRLREGWSWTKAKEAANALVEDYVHLQPLHDRLTQYPYQLSGGQGQLLSLARAFASQSSTYVFDEPYAGLDPLNRRRVRDAILEFRTRNSAVSVVVVTHLLEEAVLMADRIDVLVGEPPISEVHSHIVALPPAERTIDTPEISRVYSSIATSLGD